MDRPTPISHAPTPPEEVCGAPHPLLGFGATAGFFGLAVVLYVAVLR
jgi:hypothetical protein